MQRPCCRLELFLFREALVAFQTRGGVFFGFLEERRRYIRELTQQRMKS